VIKAFPIGLAATLGAVVSVIAQPVPKLNSLSIEWIQRGTTVTATFAGENLGSVTRFVFDGEPGLSATNVPPPVPPQSAVTIESNLGGISRAESPPPRDEKKLVASITAAADAPLGAREVRVVTPAGVSNPLLLNVGQFPEISEKEPDNSPEQAQMITLPAAISGAIGADAQVDYYRFKAARGQELVFDVDAQRRGSALDSSLAILNPAGKELARSEDVNGLDSLLEFTVPDDGEYLIQLRDYRYRGGGNFTYRLYAGALPYLDSIFPLGGQRGKQVEIALKGRNLAGTTKMTLSIAPTAPLGRQEIRANTPNGYSNLRAFQASDLPDFLETEPNDTTDKVNVVTIPVVINGRIGTPKDIDRFRFKSGADQKLICEVVASRLGSRLDALLSLTDASGKMIAQNDDAAAADARIEFDAKKETEYILALRDLTERGGDEFGYRLSIQPPAAAAEAGFTARFAPDTIRVHRGSHSKIRCEIAPISGFNGPVRFAFQEAPPGVYGEPLVLMAGAPASGLMLISALKDAPVGSFPVKLVAAGLAGGKALTRAAEPLSGDRGVRQGFITVLDAPPFTLELITLSATVEQDQSTVVEFMVQRREGWTGDVKVSAEGYSAGRDPVTKSFEVPEVTLKGAESVGKLNFKAKLDSEVGTRTIVLRGEGTVDGQPVTQSSSAMPLTVSQVPFVLSSTLSRLSVTALPTNSQSAARETSTTIKVERRAGFTGEVALALEGLPPGIQSVLEKIPADGGETTLKLTASDQAAAGTNVNLLIIGAGQHNDRNYKQRTGAIALTINAPEPVEPPVKLTNTLAAPAAASAK